jgi:heme exporter protein C
MNWTWFHKLGSPKWFYGISGKMLPWLSVAALLLIGVGVVWGLAFAPPDYQQGNSFASSISTFQPPCWRSPSM